MPHDDRLLRKQLRAPGFDYASPGTYFITICTHHMECRFGVVDDGVIRLNEAGDLIASDWRAVAERDDHLRLDEFVVMPNHLQAILEILVANDSRAPSLSAIVGSFKSLTTNACAERVQAGAFPRFDHSLWQRGFHDHIIRDERSLERHRDYIMGNPGRWDAANRL